MSIPSQLPQFVTAARSGALQALALQSGQVLDAKIVGPAPNGGTQVEIRGQLLNLVLPTLVAAGQTIKLEVQGTGQQMRLALQLSQPATPPPTSPAPAAPGPQANIPLPQQGNATALPLPTSPASILPQALPTTAPPAMPAQPGTVQTPLPGGAPAMPPPATIAVPAGAAATAPATALATALPTAAAQPPAVSPPAVAPTAASVPAPVAPPVASATAAPTTAPTAIPLPGAAIAPPAIYPQAPATPALPNPVAAAAAATALQPAAPQTPAAMPGAVRPVVPTTALANSNAHASPGNPPPQAAPPVAATTPQAALAQMVQASVPRQGSVIALTTALASIAGKVVLPEPVARAAQQVLAGRVSIDGARFDGTSLQAAVRNSGVFQEASLARGQQQLLQQPDMKSALLALRQTLTTWLGQQAPVAAVTQVPPPLRGITPRARASTPPPIDPGAAPDEVGKQLLERTESALSRVRLHQHASLPDPGGRAAEWSMDLPVMVGTHQTLMQFQIHRDQHNEADAATERGWQMRFALNLPGMGEVGAQVSLRAGAVGVMLWATEPAASASLDAEIAGLREALMGAGLQPGAIIVRHGEPPSPQPAPSGHFVDSRR